MKTKQLKFACALALLIAQLPTSARAEPPAAPQSAGPVLKKVMATRPNIDAIFNDAKKLRLLIQMINTSTGQSYKDDKLACIATARYLYDIEELSGYQKTVAPDGTAREIPVSRVVEFRLEINAPCETGAEEAIQDLIQDLKKHLKIQILDSGPVFGGGVTGSN